MLKLKTFPHQTDYRFENYRRIDGPQRLYETPSGKLPSMTTILSVLDDGGVDAWRKRVGDDEADRIVNESTTRGNSLHDLSERYLLNTLRRSDIRGAGAVLFNRAKPYLDKIEMVVAVESTLYNGDLGYAGQVDAIVMLDGQLTILDHKNTRRRLDMSKQYVRRKVFKYMLQCVGYGLAVNYMYPELNPTQGCLLVGCHEDSQAEMIRFDLEPLRDELELVTNFYNKNVKSLEPSMFFLV